MKKTNFTKLFVCLIAFQISASNSFAEKSYFKTENLIPSSCANLLERAQENELGDFLNKSLGSELCSDFRTSDSGSSDSGTQARNSYSEYDSLLKNSIDDCKDEEKKHIRSANGKRAIKIFKNLSASSSKEHWDGIAQIGFYLEDEDVDVHEIFAYTTCLGKASLDIIDASDEHKVRAISLLENQLKVQDNYYKEPSSKTDSFKGNSHVFTQIALLLDKEPEGDGGFKTSEENSFEQHNDFDYEEIISLKEALDAKEDKVTRGCYVGDLAKEKKGLSQNYSKLVAAASKENEFCSLNSKEKSAQNAFKWSDSLSGQSCEIVTELARLAWIEQSSKSAKQNYNQTLSLLENASQAKASGSTDESERLLSEAEGRFENGCQKEFANLASLVRSNKSDDFKSQLAQIQNSSSSIQLASKGSVSKDKIRVGDAPLARLNAPSNAGTKSSMAKGEEFNFGDEDSFVVSEDSQDTTEGLESLEENYLSIVENCDIDGLNKYLSNETFKENKTSSESEIFKRASNFQLNREGAFLKRSSLQAAFKECDVRKSSSLINELEKDLNNLPELERSCLKKEIGFNELSQEKANLGESQDFDVSVTRLDSLSEEINDLEKVYSKQNLLSPRELDKGTKIIEELSSFGGSCGGTNGGISKRSKRLIKRLAKVL